MYEFEWPIIPELHGDYITNDYTTCPGFRGGSIPQPTPPMPISGNKITVELKGVFDKAALVPDRILRSGPATIVFWRDGTKTVVKRSPDEPDNAYAAFTAALGIKVFGSNSALKRIVERCAEEQKK